MTARRSAFVRTVLAVALLLVALPNAAQAEGDGDGVYGRFDSALVVALGAGAGVGLSDGDAALRGVFDARLRIVSAGGPVISFAPGADGVHHLVVGMELRPFFPALFLQDMSTGHEWLDLFISSLGVELGAAFLLEGRDVGLAWGLSVELPLVFPSRFAEGLFLRLAARHVNGDDALVAVDADNRADEWLLSAQLVIGFGASSWPAAWEPPRHRDR
jgi:hypothetical protein